MSALCTWWRGLPTWAQALTALPLLVVLTVAVAAVTAWLLAGEMRSSLTRRRSTGEAVADVAEAGADEAEARAEELCEDLRTERQSNDEVARGLVGLAEREAGARYDAATGVSGPDLFGGE